MIRNKVLSVLLLLILSLSTPSRVCANDGATIIKVDSTELASLTNVMDIIDQLPGVNYTDDGIVVDGRGVAEVYIDNRKLTELTELWHTPANKVDHIEVQTTPGVQYDKTVRAVIIIYLKAVTDNGFSLDEHLRFDYSHRLATSNELTLGWKRNRLTTGVFVGWNQVRNEMFEKDYSVDYLKKKPTGAVREDYYPFVHSQQLTLKGNLGYDISPLHRIEAQYAFIRVPRSSVYVDSILSSFFLPVGDEIDFDKPDKSVMSAGLKQCSPMTRHMFNVSYRGYINKWTLLAGSNVTFEDKNTYTYPVGGNPTDYLRKETITRSYIKGSLPVGEGSFDAGVEFNSDAMEVTLDRNIPKEKGGEYLVNHTKNTDNTIAAYVNLSQKFGIWTISGGLRYEGNYFTYKPYGNDGVMKYLDKMLNDELVQKIDADDHMFVALWMNRKMTHDNHNIYPTLTLSVNLGKSTLTLSHSQSYQKAYLALTRIDVANLDNDALTAKVIKDEQITTTTLDWKWNWLDVNFAHNLHRNPVFETLSLTNVFNGDEYDDIDLNIVAAPTIGWWHPSLSLSLHKQWLDMKGVEAGKLKESYCSIDWNNSLNLPDKWMILVNANWHSRGAKSNVYYYSANLNMDAAVQKTFSNPNITLKLLVSNIFRHSYDDVTVFTNSLTNSSGYAVRNPRILSLSLKYNF